MFRTVFHLYKSAWSGLPKSSWMLALVMLINRSGAMVIPFLSLYLTQKLGFTLSEAGLCISAFGGGAFLGAFLGGKLTDKLGPFRVQAGSLLGTGLLFFVLMELTTFYSVLAGIFVLSLVSESLRPANAVSVAAFSPPDRVTRAFSLNRMAANLGFAFGPALGGLLAIIDFKLLFVADGLTCILAGIVFVLFFRKQQALKTDSEKSASEKSQSAWKDKKFILFTVLVSVYAMIFFQFFTTLPVFYRTEFHLPENEIGLLMAINGVIIFFCEMILVNKLENKIKIMNLIPIGSLLLGFSFFLIGGFHFVWILIAGMIFLTVAEMLSMPFMAAHVNAKAGHGRLGEYMAMYTMAYSFAHIAAPMIGTRFAQTAGFNALWMVCAGMSVLIAGGFWFLGRNQA